VRGSLQSSLPAGTPVSLTSSGTMQAGGGTSIYLNIASLLQASPSDLTISPIFASTYLVTSTEYKTNSTTFTVVVASPSETSTKFSVKLPFAVASVVTLMQSSGTIFHVHTPFVPQRVNRRLCGGVRR
jgi:hypothetical protein